MKLFSYGIDWYVWLKKGLPFIEGGGRDQQIVISLFYTKLKVRLDVGYEKKIEAEIRKRQMKGFYPK